MEYKFTINLPPVPQNRARAAICGKKIILYSNQKVYKKLIRDLITFQMPPGLILDPLQGAIEAEMTFHTAYPKSLLKTKKNGFPKYNTKRPDLDNFCKLALDCMNGLVYKDDSQVVKIIASKLYHENPHVEIIIRTINEN